MRKFGDGKHSYAEFDFEAKTDNDFYDAMAEIDEIQARAQKGEITTEQCIAEYEDCLDRFFKKVKASIHASAVARNPG